jgi:hypothetical protein
LYGKAVTEIKYLLCLTEINTAETIHARGFYEYITHPSAYFRIGMNGHQQTALDHQFHIGDIYIRTDVIAM